MKRSIRPVLFLGTLVLTVAWLATASSHEAGAAGLDGKEVFLAQKCNMCHSVPSEGIEAKMQSEKMKGPDIDGSATVDADQLGKYLRKQAQVEGRDHKKEFKGTDEELAALVEWIRSIKSE